MIKFNKEFLAGMTLGFGAGVVVGALVEKDKRSLNTFSKELFRVSLLSVEKLKETLVRAREHLEDLIAEVQSEVEENTDSEVLEAEAENSHSRSY